jgi:hypothetical protein
MCQCGDEHVRDIFRKERRSDELRWCATDTLAISVSRAQLHGPVLREPAVAERYPTRLALLPGSRFQGILRRRACLPRRRQPVRNCSLRHTPRKSFAEPAALAARFLHRARSVVSRQRDHARRGWRPGGPGCRASWHGRIPDRSVSVRGLSRANADRARQYRRAHLSAACARAGSASGMVDRGGVGAGLADQDLPGAARAVSLEGTRSSVAVGGAFLDGRGQRRVLARDTRVRSAPDHAGDGAALRAEPVAGWVFRSRVSRLRAGLRGAEPVAGSATPPPGNDD